MFRKLAFLLIILISAGCTQKGEVGVDNRTDGNVFVRIDSRGYNLYPGDMIIREIEIGDKAVFGPDETRVLVTGEGDYVFYFSHMVRIRDDETTILSLYCEAGQFVVTNNTYQALDFYLAACYEPDWGSPSDYIPAGSQVAWKLAPGCWDVLLTAPGYTDIYRRFSNIIACEEYGITIYSSANALEEIENSNKNADNVCRVLAPGDDTIDFKKSSPSGSPEVMKKEKSGSINN
ncbi:MAG: hypothetical protein R6U43_10160 [Candidatus Krumholzibacteriales bacterium]